MASARQIEDLIADADLVPQLIYSAHERWGRENPKIAKVCELWLLGFSSREIAREIGIDERTVRRHREKIHEWLRWLFRDETT